MRKVASYNKIKDELKFWLNNDYSESCKNAQQNEIQSAYFGHTCFTIFTACCYYGSGLSDGLENVPVMMTREFLFGVVVVQHSLDRSSCLDHAYDVSC